MAAAKEVDACVKKFEELLKASDIKQEFEGGICWACLGEDNLKDMNLTYYNNQKPEVYSDLISYCFSIQVEEEMKGTENVLNLICDKCVQRLRDAADFKALIEVNRATFKTLLCKPIEVSDCLEEYIDEEWLEEEDEEVVLDSSKALPMESATTAEKENNLSNSNDSSRNTIQKKEGAKTVKERRPRHREQLPYKLQKTDRKCKICGEVFSVHKALQMHMPGHFQKHICEQCGRGFATRAQLTSHRVVHAPAVKVCPICPNKVFKASSINRHMRRHQGKADIFIQTVKKEKDVKTVGEKKRRRREELPYKLEKTELECKICGEVFPVHKGLQMHMPSHFQKHICEQCGRGFATRAQLASHATSHRPAVKVCPFCPNKVFKPGSLKKHMQRHQGMKEAYKCTVCNIRFPSYNARRRHMVTVHGEENYKYGCKHCSKRFCLQSHLSKHVRSVHLQERNHACTLCSSKFFSSRVLKEHMQNHSGEKLFECSVCKKSYARACTLRTHMKIHSGVKAHVCCVCRKSFTQACTLRTHMTTHDKNTSDSSSEP